MNEFKNLFLAYKATIALLIGLWILIHMTILYCGFGVLTFVVGCLLTFYGLNNYKKEH